jgi:hypothetical protein
MKSRAASEVYCSVCWEAFLFAKERVIRVVYIEPLTDDSELEIKDQALSLGAWFSKNQRTGFDP